MILCTIAGTGTAGYNDINIRASETQLKNPTALVEDAAGRLLVSDAGNHQVRRFEGDDLMTVIGRNLNGEANSGPASSSPLGYVNDMDFDPDGQLAILEGVAAQISWVDLIQDQLTVFGGFELSKPSSMALDDMGNIFVADAGEGVNLVYKVTEAGEVSIIAGADTDGFPLSSTSDAPGAEENRLSNPQGLVWFEGELYLADAGRHRIVHIDVETGDVTRLAGINDQPGYGDGASLEESKLNRPSRFTFGVDGRMVIADSGNGVIRAELADGTMETVCGRGAGSYDAEPQDAEGASLGEPFDLLYDRNGDLVFTDRDHAVVRRISQPDW